MTLGGQRCGRSLQAQVRSSADRHDHRSWAQGSDWKDQHAFIAAGEAVRSYAVLIAAGRAIVVARTAAKSRVLIVDGG
jgi:hypothetical protein